MTSEPLGDPEAPAPFSGLELPPSRQGYASTSGRILDPFGPSPDPELDATGQHKGYWILSEEERKKGFVRPVRQWYRHLKCGTDTHMGLALAETYARQPDFYGATFCCHCGAHFPVGELGEFVWCERQGRPTEEKVGT